MLSSTFFRSTQKEDMVVPMPTLHKPSMMAHVVRVLKGEKTLRMHYANYSTYNADFEGDEMNVHFPQDEISRAEAIEITNANKQYIVPTSGAPIRGLIQDHIVSVVLLTKKDTFLTRDEYHMLLYASGVSTAASGSYVGKFNQKVCTLSSDDEIQPLPPVIWKPKLLWTGKQVITTILNHITHGRPPFTIKKEGKIEDGCFYSEWKEGNMVEGCFKHCKSKGKKHKLIWKNELVHGVIDKNQFAHTVQEFYGSNTAGILLSVLSRLFIVFLQYLDLKRKTILEKHENIGANIHSKFIGAKIAGNERVQDAKSQDVNCWNQLNDSSAKPHVCDKDKMHGQSDFVWGSQNPKGTHTERSSDIGGWNEDRGQDELNQPTRSLVWSSSPIEKSSDDSSWKENRAQA